MPKIYHRSLSVQGFITIFHYLITSLTKAVKKMNWITKALFIIGGILAFLIAVFGAYKA